MTPATAAPAASGGKGETKLSSARNDYFNRPVSEGFTANRSLAHASGSDEVAEWRRSVKLMPLAGCLLLIGSAFTNVATVQADDDAKKLFQAIYQADIDRARSTPTARDDIELAKSLLDVVKADDTEPQLLVVVYHQVYALANPHESGYAVAVEAMRQLASRVTDQREMAEEKTLALHEEWYQKGSRQQKKAAGMALLEATAKLADAQAENGKFDKALIQYQRAFSLASAIDKSARPAITAQLKRLRQHQQLHEQIAAEKIKLERDPDTLDAVFEELIHLHAVEIDNPQGAIEFAFLTDEATQKIFKNASSPIAELESADLMALGDWYAAHLTKARTQDSQTAMRDRAVGYYQRFLEVYKPSDLQRMKATVAIRKLEDQSQHVGSSPTKASRSAQDWVNLMVRIEPSKDAVHGTWELEGDGLRAEPAPYARLAIPVELTGDYQLELEVRRTEGAGMLAFTVPIGTGQMTMGLGSSDSKQVTIGMVRGAKKSKPIPMSIENDQWYKLSIEVKHRGNGARLKASLDGTSILTWSGAKTALRVPPAWRVLSGRVIGLGAMHSRVLYRNVRVHMTKGTLKPLRKLGT